MIQVQLTRRDHIHRVTVGDKLQEAGYIQMNPLRWEHEYLLDTDIDLYAIWPSIEDLLRKRFKTDHVYPWQRCKEILFRGFM